MCSVMVKSGLHCRIIATRMPNFFNFRLTIMNNPLSASHSVSVILLDL